jgi:prepilin-type N-terminal cleavage/methylation domain-containing protein
MKKSIRKFPQNNGFALVEVIVASVIISIVLISYYTFNEQNIKRIGYLDKKVEGLLLVNQLAHETNIFTDRGSVNYTKGKYSYKQEFISNSNNTNKVISSVTVNGVKSKIETYSYKNDLQTAMKIIVGQPCSAHGCTIYFERPGLLGG